jgi:hypothetical protein
MDRSVSTFWLSLPLDQPGCNKPIEKSYLLASPRNNRRFQWWF